MRRLRPARVAVAHEIGLHLKHPGRGVIRRRSHVVFAGAQIVGRAPDAVGVGPEASPKHGRAAAVAAGAVHLGEEDGVGQTIGDKGRGVRADRVALFHVAEHVIIGRIVADAPLVGPAIRSRGLAAGAGVIRRTNKGRHHLKVLSTRVTGRGEPAINAGLFDERQQEGKHGVIVPAIPGIGWCKALREGGVGTIGAERRKRAARVVDIVDGQAELLQVVFAFDPRGSLAHLLHGRQQQPDQDGNDGDHHQQFDQREGRTNRTGPVTTEFRHRTHLIRNERNRSPRS